MKKEVKQYKVKQLPDAPQPDSLYWVKGNSDSDISGFITDINGVAYPITSSGGIQSITNNDGSITITGTDDLVINISSTLLSTINSALQSGDNISELINDVGYLTTFTEIDPVFQASEASLFVAGDKANLDNQSGINSGDETTLSIQTKRPLKTVNNESLEGSGNIQIDYNDLNNLPTIITNHSGLTLDDGTNPHGTTKSDVGLSNVDNTSDLNKPISTATQIALDDKLDKDTTAGVERVWTYGTDGIGFEKPTSDFISPTQLLEDFYNKSAKARIEWIPYPSQWASTLAPNVTGTADNVSALWTGTYFKMQFRRRYASAATAGSSTSFRDASQRHTAIGEGFVFFGIFGNEDAANVAQARSACALIGGNGEIGNVNPSTVTNFIGVANDSGQANLHFNVSNAGSLNHNIDLGSSFPANTNSTDFYLVIMINDKGISNLKWRVVNLHSGADTGYSTITTGLPASTIGLAPQIWRNNGSTALVVKNSIMLYRLLKM